MSVQSQIDRLNAIKNRIRTNLAAQGITVPADAMLEDMATMILSVAGYTPEKGVDYWTSADQEAIVQQVIIALGTPVFGRVEDGNKITLSSIHLAENTYKLGFEDKDGNWVFVGEYSNVYVPEYTNQIPISTDTDGSIYNGTGYKAKTRGNSSGVPADITNTNAHNAVFFTGFIPAPTGSVIRLKNCFIYPTENTDYATEHFGDAPFGIRNGLYNSAKTKIQVYSWGEMASGDGSFSNFTPDSSNHVTEFTVTWSGVSYVRLCLAPTGDPADAIVTVNQEID